MVDQPLYRAEALQSAEAVPADAIHISWGAVVAGAVTAAALSFVLLTFGAALGLAVASPSATWRDASVALTLLSGLWLLLTALASFSLGGYIAGRTRTRSSVAVPDEVDVRDGVHGLLAWGLAIIIGALLGLAAARTIAAPATGNVLAPTAATAEPLLAFEIDRLFRSDRRPGEPVEPDIRAQAARILTTSLGHSDMATEDRAYLVRMVMAKTGLAPPDADRRVMEVVAQARGSIRRARATAVTLAFMAAASLLMGAAAAWFAAGQGGRHRDGEAVPDFWFGKSARPVTRVP